MTCPNCERYKQSASMWRNKAYELNGTPLPWKPDELWVGLTDEELYKIFPAIATYHEANKTLYRSIARAVEAKLKEKNT